MTTENTENSKSRRPSRAWLWLLTLPAAGVAGFVALIAALALPLMNVEKSPGYTLAVHALTTHPGVEDLLGAPVHVTETKSKFLTRRAASSTLELTFELTGSAGKGTAAVTATEKGGRWTVERATVASASGEFGLLADGGLQPLYDPKGVLAGGP